MACASRCRPTPNDARPCPSYFGLAPHSGRPAPWFWPRFSSKGDAFPIFDPQAGLLAGVGRGGCAAEPLKSAAPWSLMYEVGVPILQALELAEQCTVGSLERGALPGAGSRSR